MLEFRCYGCHEPYFVRFGSVYKNLTDKRRDRQTDIQMDKPQTTGDQKNTFEPSVQVGLKFTCTALSYFLTLLYIMNGKVKLNAQNNLIKAFFAKFLRP